MKKEFTENEIRELEKQLACPAGKAGIELANTMHKTNIRMTISSINALDIKDENSILELGHGNCGHLNELLDRAEGILYYGLEVSETMYETAKETNVNTLAEFKLYDGETISFKDNYFDRIMSVNTIYFWLNPRKMISEIERVLKSNGLCILTYANKEFMKKLPFVSQQFTLYNKKDIQNLIENTNMQIIEFKDRSEQVKSKTGEYVERKYTVVKIKKD